MGTNVGLVYLGVTVLEIALHENSWLVAVIKEREVVGNVYTAYALVVETVLLDEVL